jgi:hypothetical protein
MRSLPIILVSVALLCCAAVAWAQAVEPAAAGLSGMGTGAGSGALAAGLVIAVREGVDYLRRSRAEERTEAARDRALADAQGLRDRLARLEGEQAATRRDLDAITRSLAEHRDHVDERLDTIAERVGEAGRQIATALGRMEAHGGTGRP